MSKRAMVFAVIAGLAVVAAVALRTANRADAAEGNCYADGKGPATPTICN